MDYALGLFSEEEDHGVKNRGAGGREGEALNLSQQSLSTYFYRDGAVDGYVNLHSSLVNIALRLRTSCEEGLLSSMLIFHMLERLLLVSESVEGVAMQHIYIKY